MMFWIGYGVGAFSGFALGVLLICALITGKRADERASDAARTYRGDI